MTDVRAPAALDSDFAQMLRSTKADFVDAAGDVTSIRQHGAATISMRGWPGWLEDVPTGEHVIDTYVATKDDLQAAGDPTVPAWISLVEWTNATVRTALADHQVELHGDAYITASCIPADELGGIAHSDDDTYMPTDTVGVVAIVGQHAGPRVATGELRTPSFRPMSQVAWSDEQLRSFEANEMDHCRCPPDQLVLFPQFGQLHAGPAAAHLQDIETRQLLVYRAQVVPVNT